MASSSVSADSSCFPVLPEEPFHPDSSFVFPKRAFGKSNPKMRACQAQYFTTWPWLTYDVEKDVVFCHLCVKSLQAKKMTAKRADPSFTQRGFAYWKDATIAFKKHASSDCHKEAVEVSIVLPRSCPDVGEMLSSQHSQQKKVNRECLLKIIANLKFLARQGLALRGDNDVDSNFMQLMKLHARDDPRLTEWLEKKTNKYVSHDIQNELLKVMALAVLRDIFHSIHESTFYSIMCDECTDASNKEQLVICIRWIRNSDLEVHEDVIGLYAVTDIYAATIVKVIRDALVRMKLGLSKCRGQCYDGASNMSGPRSGVAKQLRDDEPRALYLHCHGHALNLAVGDAIKRCKHTKDALDIAFEVSKLVKFSPKRTAQLTFSFFFGANLAELVLKHTDNLSKTLQSTSMSASEGAYIAAMTVKTLKLLRTDDQFTAFWDLVIKAQQEVEVCDPELPRRRKAPSRYDDGAPGDFPRDCQAHYRQSYFEALDQVVNSIEDRFDQPDFHSYRQLEDLLMRTIRRESTQECFDFVVKFYHNDFQLRLHLEILQATFPAELISPTLSFHDVSKYIQSLSDAERSLMSEVVTLLKLVLVLPSTNAVSERSFSAMRRLKSYLRTTMKQERLNHLLLLHVHKEHTDSLSCVDVASSFVGDSEHRLSVFGRFH